jgi:hypothetical protein
MVKVRSGGEESFASGNLCPPGGAWTGREWEKIDAPSHLEPIRSSSNRLSGAKGAHGKLREGSPELDFKENTGMLRFAQHDTETVEPMATYRFRRRASEDTRNIRYL